MAEYDTRVPIGEPSDLCKEIADQYGNKLERLLELTKETGEEYGVVFWKSNGRIEVTDDVEGESNSFTKSVSGSSIKSLLSQAAEEEGIKDANEFYDKTEWVTVAHTHPTGDPSPSGGDMLAMLSHMEDMRKIQQENTKYISEVPVPTALLAVAEADNGDVIITGLRMEGEVPSLMHIGPYKDEVKSYKASATPRFFDTDAEKERWMQNKEEKYQELISNLTEGSQYRDPILELCNAVIERR